MRRVRRSSAVALALLVLAGILAACGTNSERDASQQPQGATLRIRIGTQEFPEARIIVELWRQALAVNGYTVDLRKGIGPAEDLDQALQDEEIDGYVAYTGTVLSIVAGEDVSGLDPEQTRERAAAFYASKDMFLSEMTPFENKDAIALTTDYAREINVRTIADLAEVEGLRLGARPEFEGLQLGTEGLREEYGLSDFEFVPIPLGEQYAALDDGKVDAVNAFTTDPQLESGRYVLLEDPKRLFGSQNVAMVVGQEKLDSIDADAFLEVIATVNVSLNVEEMVAMNAEVYAGRDEADVAAAYLRSAGLSSPLNLD